MRDDEPMTDRRAASTRGRPTSRSGSIRAANSPRGPGAGSQNGSVRAQSRRNESEAASRGHGSEARKSSPNLNKDSSPRGSLSGRRDGTSSVKGDGKGPYKDPFRARGYTIWVGGLPFNIDDDKVRSVFSQFGRILDIRIKHAPKGKE